MPLGGGDCCTAGRECAHDLVNLGSAIARGGKPDSFDSGYFDSPIDTVAVHPHDDKVLLGGVGVLL